MDFENNRFIDPRNELPGGENIGREDEFGGEELGNALTGLAEEHDTLEAQLGALQAEGELPIEQRQFIGSVREETGSLEGILQRLGKTGGLKRRIALAVGVIGISLMSGREANAGNKKPFNWDALINAGTKTATVLIQERSRARQEEARTVRTIGSEQIRSERDVTLEKERTVRTIGTEEIRREKDVSLGAMRVEKPTTITYISGGKEVTIDIAKGEEERKKLEEENQALQEQIRILQLRLENERLEQQMKDLKSEQGDSGEKTDGG